MEGSPGYFITLEGIEGVGKSTQAQFVGDFLRERGLQVIFTREPGGTEIGEAIRRVLLDPRYAGMAATTELLLMFAARAEHLDKVVTPALAAGHIVVCDRFIDASYAYQGGGRGITTASIDTLKDLVQGGRDPDLTLLLDAPIEVALQRASCRGGTDRFEAEKAPFFDSVRERYLELAQRDPGRIRTIDAAKSVTEVQTQITGELQAAQIPGLSR